MKSKEFLNIPKKLSIMTFSNSIAKLKSNLLKYENIIPIC